MRRVIVGLAAAFVCAGAAGCGMVADRGVDRRAVMTDDAPAFHWVGGRWEDASGEGRFEEWWMDERGLAMVGTFRLIGGRGPIVYEFMRVSSRDGRLVMEITHFDGGGRVWPNQPVVFRSTEIGADRIVFAQDGVAEKTLVYERTGKETMRVTLSDPADAAPSVFEFRRATVSGIAQRSKTTS